MGAKLQFNNAGVATIISEKSRSELDDIVFASIIDRDLTAPPSAEPTNGDRYIVASTATVEWLGKEGNIAFWHGYWAFIAPTRNMRAWLEDEKVWIEYDGTAWVHVPPAHRNVITKTADYTALVSEHGSCYTNTAASGPVIISLPAAVVGLEYMFYVDVDAQEFRIKPVSDEQMSITATGVPGTASQLLSANLAGEFVHIMCVLATEWINVSSVGTWTIAAE